MSGIDDARWQRQRRGLRRRRELLTPEAVRLPLQLADAGERAAAFVIDVVIIAGAVLLLALFATYSLADALEGAWTQSFVMLALFLLRSFYFTLFELRWQGQTPGKRLIGLRVIDRAGGPLRAEAVVARNLMREVEIFLPLSLLFSLGGNGWAPLLSLVWVGILVLLPFFNKDRLRAGDLVGGTWVVEVPRRALLPDLAAARPPAAGPEFAFTPAQLDAYGVYELRVLEEVLRQEGPNARLAVDEVSRRIRRKIGWQGPVDDPRRFLDAFYAALRARLEKGMLFGRRRESKYDRR